MLSFIRRQEGFENIYEFPAVTRNDVGLNGVWIKWGIVSPTLRRVFFCFPNQTIAHNNDNHQPRGRFFLSIFYGSFLGLSLRCPLKIFLADDTIQPALNKHPNVARNLNIFFL
jgi:hypothetical protein